VIYYFCYDNLRPTGGSAVIYRHVQLLNRAGLDAAVVHQKADFVLPGYELNPPPIIGSLQLELRPSDLLVLPGDLGPGLNQVAPGIRKILFNQNAYHSFRGYDINSSSLPPYGDPEYIATLVVSEDNRRYLEHLFPGVSCRRLHISFDHELFDCPDLGVKGKQIAFMTRKNFADVVQVIGALRSRQRLRDWRFKAIENCSPTEVAEILRDSCIYASFGGPEGISLSNLEAMLSGCWVVGYSGMGCREYFDQNLCEEVPFGDIVAFVDAVERAAHQYESDRARFNGCVVSAQGYVRDTYSEEKECSELIDFYSSLLGGVPTL
jgi:hypothetical protein